MAASTKQAGDIGRSSVTAAAADTYGHLWAIDHARGELVMFDRISGRRLDGFALAMFEFLGPTDLAVMGDSLYLPDPDLMVLRRFRASDGMEMGGVAQLPYAPDWRIAAAPDNLSVYLAGLDGANVISQRDVTNGAVLAEYHMGAVAVGLKDVAVDGAGVIYALAYDHQPSDPFEQVTYKVLARMPGPGQWQTLVQGIAGRRDSRPSIEIGPDGMLYFTNMETGVIDVYTLMGAPVTTVDLGPFGATAPSAVFFAEPALSFQVVTDNATTDAYVENNDLYLYGQLFGSAHGQLTITAGDVRDRRSDSVSTQFAAGRRAWYSLDFDWSGSSLYGTKFHDVDGDGTRESGEMGLENWTIYDDVNFNGAFDPAEEFWTTDANGDFTFTGGPAGNLTRNLAEVVKDHSVQTVAPPAVTLSMGQVIQGVDFGNRPIVDAGPHHQADEGDMVPLIGWRGDYDLPHLVADITPGSAGWNFHYPVVHADRLYFLADDTEHGQELWVYDGVTVEMVADANPDGDAMIGPMVTCGDDLYFSALTTNEFGQELHVLRAGEILLAADVFDTGSSWPQDLCFWNGRLYFSAFHPDSGRELWSYDAVTGLAELVADVYPGSTSSDVRELVVYNGELYFLAWDDLHGQSLYRFDGGQAHFVVELFGSESGSLTAVGDALYLVSLDPAMEQRVFRYRAGEPGPQLVDGPYVQPTNLTAVGSRLYFTANVGGVGWQLCWTTGMDFDFVVGPAAAFWPHAIIDFQGTLYFGGYTDASDSALYRLVDGATPTVELALDINQAGSMGVAHPAVYRDNLYFMADDGVHGLEPTRLITAVQFSPQWTVTGGPYEFLTPADQWHVQVVPCDGGTYTATLTATGNEGGVVFSDTAMVFVSDVAPAIEAGPDESVAEGDTFARMLTVVDPGRDTWTLSVDWGDGSDVEEFALDWVDPSVEVTHQYHDDGQYPVAVKVWNGEGVVEDSFVVTAGVTDPIVTAGDTLADEGSTATIDVSVTDPADSLDASATGWTFQVDFGDGSDPESFDVTVLDPGHAQASLPHMFDDDDTYTVTVTVTDDDGAVVAETATVTVANVDPVI
ncbi:MAG: PKD domain-containing protein, partial [Planctomycetota bacterium]